MDITIERTSALKIPKIKRLNYSISCIKEHLTRQFQEYNSNSKITRYFFKENNSFLFVPRFFPIEDYIPSDINIDILDKTCHGQKIEIEANIVARNELQRNVMKELIRRRCGILQIDPGEGKTVLSIYLINKEKVKSLVLVHKIDLLKQWIERFEEFTNYTFKDIAFVKSNSFKDDLQKPIIVSTVQSLLAIAKKYGIEFSKELLSANIGLLISDECHTTTGAFQFSNINYLIPAYKVIGLSATPSRMDNTDDIMEYHLGKIFQVEGKGVTLDPKVISIIFDHNILVEKNKNGNIIKNRYNYLYWNNNFTKSRYLNILKNSEIYMSLIDYLIFRCYNENRHVLCLCERIKQIEESIKRISKRIPRDDIGGFYGISGKEELKKKIIFATPQKARDGMDEVTLDTLILCSPLANITQASGRIVRYHKNKKTPIVFDIVDNSIQEFLDRYSKRKMFYNSKNWQIEEYTWDGKQLKEI